MRNFALVILIVVASGLVPILTGCQPMPIPTSDQWKSASLIGGDFRLKFPYEPKSVTGSQGETSLSSSYRNEIGFNAVASNLGIDDPQSADVASILNNAVMGAAEQAKCDILENKEIVVSETIECRDALYAGSTGDLFRTRVYFSRQTGNLYQASVFGASKEIVYGPYAKTFFGSIQLEKK